MRISVGHIEMLSRMMDDGRRMMHEEMGVLHVWMVMERILRGP